MEETVIKFGDTKIEEQKFHQHMSPILINNIDINKILLFNKVSFGKNGFQYFISDKDAKKFRPLRILAHVEQAFMKLNICLF